MREHSKWILSAGKCGRCADLSYVDLSSANLGGVDLSYAYLNGANLSNTFLNGANLNGATLRRAKLRGTMLDGANLNGATGLPSLVCPEKGTFIGFKKIFCNDGYHVIAKLEIPEDAKRSSAIGRKCRCDKAKVLSITKLNGDECEYKTAYSMYDPSFCYEVGQTVSVDDFDDNRWNECAPGIHFFITRYEAVEYAL